MSTRLKDGDKPPAPAVLGGTGSEIRVKLRILGLVGRRHRGRDSGSWQVDSANLGLRLDLIGQAMRPLPAGRGRSQPQRSKKRRDC